MISCIILDHCSWQLHKKYTNTEKRRTILNKMHEQLWLELPRHINEALVEIDITRSHVSIHKTSWDFKKEKSLSINIKIILLHLATIVWTDPTHESLITK